MQEKFVLRTLKKVAAIGTGVAMAGATLTGALALDLADYPDPYVDADGVYADNNVFVVGDNALAADTLGVADITASLQFESKTVVAGEGTTVSVEGGKTEEIPLAMDLAASNLFDSSLQDDDVANLFDGEISFQGTSYDTSEELQFTTGSAGPRIVTSLNSSDDEYTTEVGMELYKRDLIRFLYKFDESINMSLASTTQPLEIEFLGDTFKITAIDSATKFTAYVGDEHYLSVGDSVTVDDKTVTLNDVSSTAAVVDVDGETEIISTSSSEYVNGIEVSVDSVFSSDTKEDRSAVLIIGAESQESYETNTAYVGEDEDDPNWKWVIAGLTTQGTSQTFGIKNEIYWTTHEDNLALVGECIDLPNEYVQICLDSLTVGTDDYMTLEFAKELEFDPDAFAATSLDVIEVTTTQSEGLELIPGSIGSTGDVVINQTSTKRVDKIWLYMNSTSIASINGTVTGGGNPYVDIFYEDGAKNKYFGSVVANESNAIARINYENTKDTNIVLTTNGSAGATTLGLFLDIVGDAGTSTDLPDGADDITSYWTAGTTGVTHFGTTATTDESGEIIWQGTGYGTKDEDHRTAYGIVVKNPESGGDDDKLVLEIPNDQVFANIVIKGSSTTVSASGTSYVPAAITPVTKLASEVGTASSYNLIVVGGPCANSLVEDLFDMTCDGWAFESGEAVIKLADNGDNVAMLVAGTTADDTRRAAKVVADYSDYTLSGEEVMMTATSDDNIEIGEVVEEEAEEEEEAAEEEEAEEEEEAAEE